MAGAGVEICGDAVPASLEMLIPEYAKCVMHRGWSAFPSELPAKILAKQSHDGHIERQLMVPIEDLGDGWYIPGTVGQEVYGAGAAPLFAAWAYHDTAEGNFLLYCDYVTGKLKWSGSARRGKVQFQVRGDPRLSARTRLIPVPGKRLPRFRATQGKGKGVELEQQGSGRDLELTVRGGAPVTIQWGGS